MKKKLMITVVMIAVAVTGCGITTIDTAQDELKLVSEYAAGLLLKYDKNYNTKLDYDAIAPTKAPVVDIPTVTVEPTIQPTQKEEQKPVQSNHPENGLNRPEEEKENRTLSEVWNQEGIEFTYKGAALHKQYPSHSEENYIVLEAKEGTLYCIVEFQLKNVSDQSITLNSVQQHIRYTLESQTENYPATLTMLMEDIHFWKAKLGASESKKAIVVFVVPEQMDLSKTTCTVSRGKETAKMLLK